MFYITVMMTIGGNCTFICHVVVKYDPDMRASVLCSVPHKLK